MLLRLPSVGRRSHADGRTDPSFAGSGPFRGDRCRRAEIFDQPRAHRYIVARDEQTFSNIVDSYRLIGRTLSRHRVYDVTNIDTAGTTVRLALTPLLATFGIATPADPLADP